MSQQILREFAPVLALAGAIALTILSQVASKSKSGSNVTVTELWVYPIKSCQGIQVSDAVVTPRGFEFDRWFMVVDADGEYLSQRGNPLLARIGVTVEHRPGILTVVVSLFQLPTVQ
jgi:hypothetical protein